MKTPYIIAGQIAVMVMLYVGCKTIEVPDVVKPPVVVTTTTTTTTSTTTTTIPPMITPDYTKDFNWDDAEKDNGFVCGGVEIRCLVNDNLMGKDAWITGLAQHEMGIIATANADGSVLLIGNDFESDNNSYHFEGWKIKTDQSKLVVSQSILLKGSDKGGTTRGYWRTVKSNKPATAQPVKPTVVSDNVPDIDNPAKYAGLSRNTTGRLCQPNEFHGMLTGFASKQDCFMAKYGMRGWFENIAKVRCGKLKGEVLVFSDDNKVTWSVNQ